MSQLAVTALGMVSPFGPVAVQACAAMRAGMSRLAEYEGYFCMPPDGPAAESAELPEPVKAGRVRGLADDLDGRERLLALARPALESALIEARVPRRELPRTALLLAVPARDPVVATWDLGKTFARELCKRTGLNEWAGSETIEAGPAGVFKALETARALLGASRVDRCVVLAVDTLLDTDRLKYLDESWRIRSQRNPDGFLPGEAGVAIVLEPRRAAERRGAAIAGLIDAAAFAGEPTPIGAERWSSGSGLCDALRPLLEGPEGTVGRYVLCDLNGEAYRAHEWGLAQVRLSGELPPVTSLMHPAEAIGDTGVALAGVLVACACRSFVRNYAPAPAALLWVSSDDGGRAAVVVRPAARAA